MKIIGKNARQRALIFLKKSTVPPKIFLVAPFSASPCNGDATARYLEEEKIFFLVEEGTEKGISLSLKRVIDCVLEKKIAQSGEKG